MAVEEEEGGCDIPEWVVTFGDMMSLLLTFFIMLVSMSEIKEEETYQAMVESFRQQFGHTTSQASLSPGQHRPRNSDQTHVATKGRAKRQDTAQGGDKVKAPVGDNKRVQSLRPNQRDSIGTVLVFDELSIELVDEHKDALRQLLPQIAGMPQKIEVRGHTTNRPFTADDEYDDAWQLAYAHTRTTMNFLVDELGLERQRIRISAAGPHEPYHIGVDAEKMKVNSRVEVFLLDEVVTDFVGTADERDQRYVQP